MIEINLSRRAESDLRAIWRYIALEDQAAADRVLLQLDKRMQALREFPEMGPARDDIRAHARVLVEGQYLILYEYHRVRALIEIVAVVDGRRDLSALF